MITALAKHFPNFTALEIIYPDRQQHEFQKAANQEAANQVLNELNCNYIIAKLRLWLLGAASGDLKPTAARLYVILGTYEKKNLEALRSVVTEHKTFIEQLEPADHSSNQYKYYKKLILPILTYCAGPGDQDTKK
jgi:hypothetical protein